MTSWRDPDLWLTVAAELRDYRSSGLAALLTEDTVRFAAARALIAAGVDPAGLRVESPHPVLRGSRIDLVAGGPPPAAFLEFKYPREPVEKNAAWTMMLGEVLADFYRLAACPGPVDRLFVYVESDRLHRYIARAAGRYGIRLDVDYVSLRPDDAVRLPATAARSIGRGLAQYHVSAGRLVVIDVDETLRLSVYAVDATDPHPAARRVHNGI